MPLINEQARIIENECVGPRLYLMVLQAPRIAESIEPGQFVHVKIPGMADHILRRPFSVYATNPATKTIDILYQTVGYGTDFMTTLTADEGALSEVEVLGPVGRCWMPPEHTQRALLVGGGVGAAPLYMLAEQLVETRVHTDVILGAQTEQALVCRGRYEVLLSAGTTDQVAPLCSTDDGSFGRAGFATSLVAEALEAAGQAGKQYDYVAVCGPEPLMRAVADLCAGAGVYCEVSMERRMACGIGACLSCVVETTEGKLRACVDGPIFEATKVVW